MTHGPGEGGLGTKNHIAFTHAPPGRLDGSTGNLLGRSQFNMAATVDFKRSVGLAHDVYPRHKRSGCKLDEPGLMA